MAICRKLLGYRLPTFIPHFILRKKWGTSVGESLNIIGKGNKERTVYISAIAELYLRKYITSRLDDSPALFVSERSPYKRIGKRTIQREIDKIMTQSGLQKNIYPHLIRHTSATHWYCSGMSLSVIQEILGHGSPATTQIYAQISKDEVQHSFKKYA